MPNRARRHEGFADRRAFKRHPLSLRVEIWPKAKPKNMQPLRLTTQNISTKGFYFLSSRLVAQGTRLNFRMQMPRKLTGGSPKFMSGIARCVRVENILGSGAGHYGIGMQIERARYLKNR